MRAPPRVLGFLARGLGHELSAVQQYMTHARLAQAWGMPEVAKTFDEEVAAELRHADRIVAAMLALGAIPNATALRPVRVGAGLVELLQHDRDLEVDAVQLYRDAALYCARIGDETHRQLFEALLADEREHAEELSAWINRLSGPATYAAAAPGGPR